MSTTIPTHPPQRIEPPAPSLRRAAHRARRPTPLERLALRLGLVLITYGRRRRAVTRDQASHASEQVRSRESRERDWAKAGLLLGPPR